MKREEFIKLALLNGLLLSFGLPTKSSAFAETNQPSIDYNEAIVWNSEEVAKILKNLAGGVGPMRRSLGFDMANMAAAYVEPLSPYYRDQKIERAITDIVDFLASQQKADGTLDFGNLSSPPDTGFIIDPLCAAYRIMDKQSGMDGAKKNLKSFILKAADQLAVGGIHTPNHRWVVSSALAKTNALFPNPIYVKRINQWLAEKVFSDEDGVYLERSMTYAEVVNRSLIFLATYNGRTELLDKVAKNLTWIYYMMEPNGEVVTVQSRRQDAFHERNVVEFYIHYRYMALKQNNGFFGAMVRQIEGMPHFKEEVGKNMLYYFHENEELRATPPVAELPVAFEKLYKGIDLLRYRKGKESLTFFAGTDWPTIIASGRSTNPNLLMYRKGEAVLKYVRLSTSFFSTGYFRGKGLTFKDGKYITANKIEAPYYQPLPKKYLKKDGDYQLSPSTDGRFWNKMDFSHRPQSNIQTLDTVVELDTKANKKLLKFKIDGPAGVRVTLECCFREGGEFKHVEKQGENYVLKEGFGTYTVGGDTIQIGPGLHEHSYVNGLEGEMYSTHFGTLKTQGNYLYITGLCPFEYTLELS